MLARSQLRIIIVASVAGELLEPAPYEPGAVRLAGSGH
jgi:hypothetical protein